MKKYGFSLQRVLNAREAARYAVEQRLALVLCELERARAARSETVRLIGEQIQAMERCSGGGGGTSHEYMLHVRYVEELQQHLLVHAKLISRIQQQADAIRVELHAAVRACKSLENLNDREKASWLDAVKREEQGQLDETAVQGYYRRQTEGIL
ncbi:MAG: flagellar export protein FliJ [Kiritimatiellae bacterium]|nr:flagellar export protein FliJ [Kiritimatiellia bacterium]